MAQKKLNLSPLLHRTKRVSFNDRYFQILKFAGGAKLEHLKKQKTAGGVVPFDYGSVPQQRASNPNSQRVRMAQKFVPWINWIIRENSRSQPGVELEARPTQTGEQKTNKSFQKMDIWMVFINDNKKRKEV